MRELFRRVDQQYYLSEYVHYNIGRVVHTISIVRVCPISIHRRVVHKIDYRSVSTIYIGGLSTGKHKYLCLEMVFIHGKMIFDGVGEDLIHGHDESRLIHDM